MRWLIVYSLVFAITSVGLDVACASDGKEAGGGGWLESLRQSGKVGEHALSLFEGIRNGDTVEVDVSFSAEPVFKPFYRPGLDDVPQALSIVRRDLLASANLAEKDIALDLTELGVLSVRVSGEQAVRLAQHPQVRSLGVLPPMQGFTSQSANISNFQYVWNAGFQGDGVVTAVIDNGFSPNHPGLPVVSRQACFCRIPTQKLSCCANGASQAFGPGSANYIGFNTGFNPGEASQIHGTSVFATLAQNAVASTGNEAGLARGITPLLINIGGTTSSGFNGTGGYVQAGLKEALASMLNGAVNSDGSTHSDVKLINMSFGYAREQPPLNVPCTSLDEVAITSILTLLHQQNKTPIAAAGNFGDTRMVWPACVPQVISVGSAWNQGGGSDYCVSNSPVPNQIACASNRNSYIDLVAPGYFVTLARSIYNSGNYQHDHVERTGTSFAAPAAVACAASLKQAQPSATPEQLRTALTTSSHQASLPGTTFQKPALDCARALDAVRSTPRIPIANAGLSGAWYEPRTSGQGFYLNVYPANGQLWAGWFTYDTVDTSAQGRRWYTLQNAAPFNAQSTEVSLTILRSTGGNFNAPPAVSSSTSVGTATLSFTSCINGSLEFQFNDGRSGTIPLVRLDPPLCNQSLIGDVNYTGLWHRNDLPGQGLSLRVMPQEQRLFGAWFTYKPNGSGNGAAGQEWYSIDTIATPGTPYNSTSNSANFAIVATTGGRFDASNPTTVAIVGSGSIQFSSCTNASLNYSFNDGRQGSMALTRVGPAAGPC